MTLDAIGKEHHLAVAKSSWSIKVKNWNSLVYYS